MTLSQSPLRASATLATALMASALMFTASAGQARSNPVVYTAELAAPVEAANHIIRGTVIRCAGTECKGRKSSSSIRTVCANLAGRSRRTRNLSPTKAKRLMMKLWPSATTENN